MLCTVQSTADMLADVMLAHVKLLDASICGLTLHDKLAVSMLIVLAASCFRGV